MSERREIIGGIVIERVPSAIGQPDFRIYSPNGHRFRYVPASLLVDLWEAAAPASPCRESGETCRQCGEHGDPDENPLVPYDYMTSSGIEHSGLRCLSCDRDAAHSGGVEETRELLFRYDKAHGTKVDDWICEQWAKDHGDTLPDAQPPDSALEERELEGACRLARDLGYATGHADTYDDLFQHVREQRNEDTRTAGWVPRSELARARAEVVERIIDLYEMTERGNRTGVLCPIEVDKLRALATTEEK